MNPNFNRKSFFLFFVLLNLLFLPAKDIFAQLDSTFGTNGVTTTAFNESASPVSVFLLPDGKFLVVATTTQSANRYYFVRYNSDGTLDTTYGDAGKVYLEPISGTMGINARSVVRQPDGKIIIAGGYQSSGIIARFNENGTLDTSFASGGIHRPNINQSGVDYITAAVVQPDGKILVGGNAAFPFSPARTYLLRYNANGTLDESFGSEGYSVYNNFDTDPGSPKYLFLQSTGKIIFVSGVDSAFNGGAIRRFNANGTLDNTFAPQFIAPDAYTQVTVQPDDKILVAYYVSRNDTLDRNHTDIIVTRFNANGGTDTNFGNAGMATVDATGALFDDFPLGLQVLTNGEILIKTQVQVQPNRNSAFRGPTLSLVRLSPTGAINGRLLITNATGWLNLPILVQPDGKIVLLDSFSNPTSFRTDILLARVTGVPPQTYKFKGVPFDFRFPNFDGHADPSVFRPSDRRWYFLNVFPGYFYGLADDILVPGDYIKDLAADMAVFRPSNGTWYIARDYQNAASNYITVQWGQTGDIPAPADFDGDGKYDLTVFRPSNGTWYIRNSADNSSRTVQWGTNGDKPVTGDYDGDGFYDIAVYRPSDGNWYILQSSNNQPLVLHFGINVDIPVQEDYDGDGKTDIAVYRPTDGIWYRTNSSDASFYALQWGIPADIPVPADYDGDRKTDIAVWRQGNGRWYVYQSSTNSMNVFNWGVMGDVPLEAR